MHAYLDHGVFQEEEHFLARNVIVAVEVIDPKDD